MCVEYTFITVSCPVLTKPPNGVLSTSAANPGVIVTLYCNDGFQLHGTPNITCLVNGFWSNSLATCDQRKPETVCFKYNYK